MRLLSTMNNFHATKRYNSNERERTVPALSIDDGVNFVQEGEDEPEEAQEGAAFIQRGEAARPRAPPKRNQALSGRRQGGGAKLAEAPGDKAKERTRRDKQVAPQTAKPSTCLHCGGPHAL